MIKRPLLVLFACAAVTGVLRADIIPNFIGAAPDDSAQNTVWTYNADITAEQNATNGDFFTIYDFGSFIVGSNQQPADWTFSFSLVTAPPAMISVPDDATLYNLTWTYTGSSPIIGNSAAGQNIGPFSIMVSGFQGEEVPLTVQGWFAAQGTAAGGSNPGTKINNVGRLDVPAPIPEPSTIALVIGTGGLGLLGRALARRRRL
jgi:hypothetical protein